jgi:hypothetical protein
VSRKLQREINNLLFLIETPSQFPWMGPGHAAVTCS